MLVLQIFGGQTIEVPAALDLRQSNYIIYLIGFLSFSFLFIAVSRMSNSRSVSTVITVFFKNASSEQILKENMRMSSLSSILLQLNYFICFALCIFLALIRVASIEYYYAMITALGLPLGLFLLEVFGPVFIGFIVGEYKSIASVILNTLTGNQFFGLIYSVLAMFWIMNPEGNRYFFISFIFMVCLKYIIRMLKSSYSVLTKGISWYYIILYFCTLEILPLFVVVYYVKKNFFE